MTKIAATLAAAVALAALASAPALAQSATGTIQLRGSVAQSCTIAVQDLNQSLNLVAGESNREVGRVVETCNSGTGYNITVASANKALTSNASGSVPVAYTLAYDNQAGNPTANLVVARATAQFGKQSSLTVTVPASASRIAGDYADTLTVTIAAK